MPRFLLPVPLFLALALLGPAADAPGKKALPPQNLPGTRPLTLTGDVAAQLVAGVDAFLLREIEASVAKRESFFHRDTTSAAAWRASLAPNRKRLAHILGVRDARKAFGSPELVATLAQPALVGKGAGYHVFAVRWPAFGDVHGEGLLLAPVDGKPAASVVAVPDADVTPEQLAGLAPGVKPGGQFVRRLAESGCRVLVPTLIDRTLEKRNGRAKLTSREFLYRPAFELGRHLVGYEVQKILAGVDWFAREGAGAKIGVWGHGEGGLLALYAAALDPRVTAVTVSGAFGNRNRVWEQPIDRNVFGLLEQFGDAELAAMVVPAAVVVEQAPLAPLTLPGEGGAPAKIASVPDAEVKAEFARAGKIVQRCQFPTHLRLVEQRQTADGPDSTAALRTFLGHLGGKLALSDLAPVNLRRGFDPRERQRRQVHEIDRHNQDLLTRASAARQAFLPIVPPGGKGAHPLDWSSPAAFAKTARPYREYFATEVVGRFDRPLLPANPRTRLFLASEKWTIYQVVLDVYPGVFAYGLLVLPAGLKPGERRPVVVCQHGLEGRPEHVIGKEGFGSYKAFATRLAERGFITFAPQNLYIGGDRFRTLQRKANPIKRTLFSVIVPQHQQITDWLKTLPNVDGTRIGFYGLSYGGKSAMRIPPLVSNYALSVCSADFNDWVWKNASSQSPYSYVWTNEYEIFEFDLANTFNYAEMAALIAPRPFMVERGHFDGVAPDERVALEFARVRHLYQAKLGLGDRAQIEWFVGPHTINGKGTFAFLHRHLKWPAPGETK
jgi:dienelactone hydrolase